MKKILVTGGAGFIGSHVVDEYLNNNYSVVVIDNLSTGQRENLPENVKIYEADITDGEEVEKIFTIENPDILNHHAAQINVRESLLHPDQDAQINIIGGLHLLEAARKVGVQKVIFSSTGGAIYGDTEDIPTSERHEEKPISPYGIAKLTFEKYCYYYSVVHGIPYTILRYSNVYGPRQNAKGEAGVVSIFINRILQGNEPIINGNGKQTRDYVYVKDVARANLLAAERIDIQDIFNIGTGVETDVNELFDMITSVFNNNLRRQYGPRIEGEQMRSCLDFSKIQNQFGWKPETMLSDGIRETVDFFIKRHNNGNS